MLDPDRPFCPNGIDEAGIQLRLGVSLSAYFTSENELKESWYIAYMYTHETTLKDWLQTGTNKMTWTPDLKNSNKDLGGAI